MSIKAETAIDLIAVAPNRVANCSAWGRNGLVAYGASSFVAIYDPMAKRVIATLGGHKGRVNSVKWLRNTTTDFSVSWREPEDHLISASSDHTLILWKRVGPAKWIISETLSGHTDSVNEVAIHSYDGDLTLAVTCSSDNTVMVWSCKNKDYTGWTNVQRESLGSLMALTVQLTVLPGNVPLFAAGTVDSLIRLFIWRENKFHKLLNLQGHVDWVRDLAFAECDDGDILLASASQDRYIRLWRIAPHTAAAATSAPALSSSGASSTTLSTKGHLFPHGETTYSVLLESVLGGHDDWVHSVCWAPPVLQNDKKHQPMSLLSASMDRTMMVWRPQADSGVWLNEVRVGEMGGNLLGFYGCQFGVEGKLILAHGYNGAFHLWALGDDACIPLVTVSGHFGPVTDLMWDPNYNYLLSVSEDQTARIFARWDKPNQTTTNTSNALVNTINNFDASRTPSWHEIARPQIHGHDMACATFVHTHPHRFVSGAEEKIMRVFDGPQTFIETLTNLSNVTLPAEKEKRALGANLPPLGLSNKPVYNEEGESGDQAEAKPQEDVSATQDNEDEDDPFEPAPVLFSHVTVYIPPFEEHLLQNTLWPEINKLYGHGNEMMCVTSAYNLPLIASACKATKPSQATIKLWDTVSWKEMCQLPAHALTVIQLEFSHNDKYLLSVSRDRFFSVFASTSSEAGPSWKLVCKVKAHERIIWSGSWSHDDNYLATASRDKTVKIWGPRENGSKWVQEASLTFKAPATAVAWCPVPVLDSAGKPWYVLVVGLETGEISLWHFPVAGPVNPTLLCDIDPFICHADTVSRLRWRKPATAPEAGKPTVLQLATSGLDHSVRIMSIKFT